MKLPLLVALGMLAAAPAFAQSASFEAQGFPMSLVQAQVLAGLTSIAERPAPPEATAKGMPVLPAQQLVLAPKPRGDDDSTPLEVGLLRPHD